MRELKSDGDVFRMFEEYYNIESIDVMILPPDGACDFVVALEATNAGKEENGPVVECSGLDRQDGMGVAIGPGKSEGDVWSKKGRSVQTYIDLTILNEEV